MQVSLGMEKVLVNISWYKRERGVFFVFEIICTRIIFSHSKNKKIKISDNLQINIY